VEIVDFEPHHYRMIEPQPQQVYLSNLMTDDELLMMSDKNKGSPITIMINNKPILCGGIYEIHPSRGVCWVLMSAEAGKYFVRLLRVAERFISTSPFRRIEAYVDRDFEQAHRLVLLLGFDLEGDCLRCFLPNGGHASLYARVK
jgi:hypothetical protein